MEISKELGRDILEHLECAGRNCADCDLHKRGIPCGANKDECKVALSNAIAGVERNGNVSRENAASNAAVLPELDKATKYITIPVAEYHFLTKAATMLEIILADKSYSPNTVVSAVRTVVQEMVQQAEAGAAE